MDFGGDFKFDFRVMEGFFNLTSVGIIVTDFLGSIFYINPFFTEITGYEAEEILGDNYCFCQAEGYETDHQYRTMWDDLQKNNFGTGKIYNVKKDGDVVPFWVSGYKVFDIDNNIYFMFFYNEFYEKDGGS